MTLLPLGGGRSGPYTQPPRPGKPMPIYEFRCTACGAVFDKMMKISDPTPVCAECGHTEVQKLVSTTSFILKGGGWYKDHYGLKSGTDAKKSESKPDPKPAPKSE